MTDSERASAPAGASGTEEGKPNWQQMFTDEQAAHQLTAETLTKNLRDVTKMEGYRVERDRAVAKLREIEMGFPCRKTDRGTFQQLAALFASLHGIGNPESDIYGFADFLGNHAQFAEASAPAGEEPSDAR